MKLEQKRKAVESGLQPFLSDEALSLALQIWEARYATEPAFALQPFIRELCDNFIPTMPRARVLVQQSLLKALNGLPTPTAAAPSTRSPTPQTRPQARPEPQSILGNAAVRTCMLLIDSLTDRLSRTDGQFLRQFLLHHLSELQQPEPAQQALRAWLSHRQPITLAIPEVALTQLINLAYIALCERQGPTQADQTLHDTVMRVETTGTGQSYSVRRLL